MPRGGRNKNIGQAPWFFHEKQKPKDLPNGWRFSLKGSPRHYDDILGIIEADPGARVYFGEALTYERGAGVALWRIEALSLDWLPHLYDWWAEMERIEPIHFTFHLYMPADHRYPVLDLREHTPDAVAAYIREHAPTSEQAANTAARRM